MNSRSKDFPERTKRPSTPAEVGSDRLSHKEPFMGVFASRESYRQQSAKSGPRSHSSGARIPDIQRMAVKLAHCKDGQRNGAMEGGFN